MTDSLPDADALRQFLIRKFLTATIGGRGALLVAQDAEAAADAAMAVVRPVLEGLAAELELARAMRGSGEPPGALL